MILAVLALIAAARQHDPAAQQKATYMSLFAFTLALLAFRVVAYERVIRTLTQSQPQARPESPRH